MLNNVLVKDYLEAQFNEFGKEVDEEFKFYDGAGRVECKDAGKINGNLTQTGNNNISKIMNYTNVNSSYELELVVSVMGGFRRQQEVIYVVNKAIEEISCRPLDIFGGVAIFTFKMPNASDLEIRASFGNSIKMKIYIELQYSSTSGAMYEMALLDFPFDEQSQNTRWFPNREAQVEWYDEKIKNAGVPFSYLMQPVQSSHLTTQNTYINDLRYYPEGTEKVVDANEVLLKNYAVVREIENGIIKNYWFYFVQSSKIGPDNQITVDLKMDTIQTYYFHPDIEFSDCMIHRAHLNRFLDNGDGTVNFDGSENSNMFIQEDNNDRAKRLIKRTQLGFKFDDEEVQGWLKENINGWVYVYLQGSKIYTFKNIDGGSRENKQFIHDLSYIFQPKSYLSGIGYDGESGIFCFPIYKNSDRRIRIVAQNSMYVEINQDGEKAFRNLNEGTSFYYQIKLSLNHPFYPGLKAKVVNNNLEISGKVNIVDGSTNNGITINGYSDANGTAFRTGDTNNIGILALRQQILSELECERYTVNEKFSFLKQEIIESQKSHKFNPKMLNQKFKEIQINTCGGDVFIYDLQKINNNELNLMYSEPLIPEITKGYLRNKGQTGLYVGDTDKNYLGLVTSNDTSFSFANDQYRQFLANNKNFWLQSNLKILGSAGMGLLGGLMAGGSGMGIGSSLVGGISSLLDRNMQIDNMKAAPDQMKNANGNALFNLMISPLSIYVEEFDILESEKEIINDVLFKNGFAFNKVSNVKKYDNLRKYFNYLQADIENINGVSILNSTREDIRQKFAQGIRFWNDDVIQYSLENYEKWLEVT